MIVPINPQRFTDAGLEWQLADDGQTGTFTIPHDNGPKPMTVVVQVSGGGVNLLPNRSFMHKTILQKLGIPT